MQTHSSTLYNETQYTEALCEGENQSKNKWENEIHILFLKSIDSALNIASEQISNWVEEKYKLNIRFPQHFRLYYEKTINPLTYD